MPLLLCPNDNASMQTVKRSGVEFDMCPTCRGVWLDRGELEKLMTAAAQDHPPPAAHDRSAPDQARYRSPTQYRDHDDDDYRRHQHGKKRRGLDIFDIFD